MRDQVMHWRLSDAARLQKDAAVQYQFALQKLRDKPKDVHMLRRDRAGNDRWETLTWVDMWASHMRTAEECSAYARFLMGIE